MRDHGGNIDAAKRHFGGEAWIDLSTGINRVPYPMPAISPQAWETLPTKSVMHQLCATARAAYLVAEAADIAPFAGAQGAIQLLPNLGHKGRARIFGPTYNEHAAALTAAGWDVETVSNIAELAGADLGVVVNPNNPNGACFAPADLLAIKQKVTTLIVDESFADPRPDLSLAPFAGQIGLFILRSFGKFYGLAGLRLGFVIGNPDQIETIRDMAGPWPVCGPAIEVGTLALADAEWAETTTARLHTETVRLDALAEAAGWEYAGGCHLFRLYSSPSAIAAQEQLARHQIWSRIFPWSEDLIRLGLPGTEREWDRLATAMRA